MHGIVVQHWGSFDLFPQHCILPTFTLEQHTTEVHRELFKSTKRNFYAR
jgi:hypothetical protein